MGQSIALPTKDAGVTRYLCGKKNDPQALPYHIHKNQLKIGHRPKCHRYNYKSSRRKYL